MLHFKAFLLLTYKWVFLTECFVKLPNLQVGLGERSHLSSDTIIATILALRLNSLFFLLFFGNTTGFLP